MLILLLVVLYFAPTAVSYSRGHNNAPAILILNLFLGWTVLGWILAAIWCSTDNVGKPARLLPEDPTPEHIRNRFAGHK